MDLLAWWNLVFELPLLAAFLYVALLATGTVAVGEGGDADQDVDAGPGADADHDHGIEHVFMQGHEPPTQSTVSQVLTFFGLGRVPLSILLISLCTTWSVFGWISNQVLQRFLPPAVFFWISFATASALSLMLTRHLARILSRLLPSVESYGVSRDQFTGLSGEARYAISEDFGEAQVRDMYGNLHQVSCRVAAGQPPISAGSKVVLLEYMNDKRAYIAITEGQFEDLIDRRP